MSTTALRLVNGVPRMQVVAPASSLSFYDQTFVAGAGGLAAGTPITLPAGGFYVGSELKVFFRGQGLEYVFDYTYVGTGNKTQIALNFDLIQGDRIRFTTEQLS